MKKLVAVLALAALAGLPVAADARAARHYEGKVVSVDRDHRTFRLRDSERGTITIRVTKRTRFEDLAGFRSLRSGMRRVEAAVHRSHGRWVASHVERSGGGGSHGGGSSDDSGGADDNGGGSGSSSDDPPAPAPSYGY